MAASSRDLKGALNQRLPFNFSEIDRGRWHVSESGLQIYPQRLLGQSTAQKLHHLRQGIDRVDSDPRHYGRLSGIFTWQNQARHTRTLGSESNT